MNLVLSHFLNRKSAVTAIVAILLCFSLGISGVYGLPKVTLMPANGPQGTAVTINASGFTPNGKITVSLWNGTTTSSYTADVNGNLKETVTVPAVATGIYGLSFTDVSNGRITLVTFNVTQSNLPTTSLSPSPTLPEFPFFAFSLFALVAASAVGWIVFKKKGSWKI